MRIAVIAPGAMGAAIAQRLHARGGEVAVTLDQRGPASARRAEGLTLMDSESALADWAEMVLSIVPPGEAAVLARRVRPALGAGAIYVDCNAVSPRTVQAIAADLPGVAFADVGIIGGPPLGDDAGPRLYASGEAAERLLPLRELGIDLRSIAGGVGAASALKMSYAGITKGLTAIGSAMALAADESGASDALRAELADSQPQLLAALQRGVPGMFDKAYRWVAEMEEIAAFLDGAPAAPIYEGAARLYEAIAADRAVPAPDGPVATLAAFYGREP